MNKPNVSNTSKPSKSGTNTFLNSLNILQALKEISSKDEPASAKDIQTELSRGLVSQDKSTTYRRLDDIVNSIKTIYTKKKFMRDFGFAVGSKKIKGSTGYYYESVFSPEELLLLLSCIESHPYITTKEMEGLYEKIKSIHPKIFKDMFTSVNNRYTLNNKDQSERFQKSKLMQNIALLSKCLREKDARCIRISYFKYRLSGSINTGTIKNEDILTESREHIVEPVALTWANGYCYLLAVIKERQYGITNFRVDHIEKIELLDEPAKNVPKDFNIIEYEKSHPIMHADDVHKIQMLCADTKDYPIASLLMDTFGKNHIFMCYKSTDAEIEKYLKHPRDYYEGAKAPRKKIWYTVVVNAGFRGTALWAMQYADVVRIAEPPSAVAEVKNRLQEACDNY